LEESNWRLLTKAVAAIIASGNLIFASFLIVIVLSTIEASIVIILKKERNV